MTKYDTPTKQTVRSRLEYTPIALPKSPRRAQSELEEKLLARAFPSYPLTAQDKEFAMQLRSALQYEPWTIAANVVAYFLRNDGASNPPITQQNGMLWGNVPYLTTAINLIGLGLQEASPSVQEAAAQQVQQTLDELTADRIEKFGIRRGINPKEVPRQLVRSIDAQWLYRGVIDEDLLAEENELVAAELKQKAALTRNHSSGALRYLPHYGLAPQFYALSSGLVPQEQATEFIASIEEEYPGYSLLMPRGKLPTKFDTNLKPVERVPTKRSLSSV